MILKTFSSANDAVILLYEWTDICEGENFHSEWLRGIFDSETVCSAVLVYKRPHLSSLSMGFWGHPKPEALIPVAGEFSSCGTQCVPLRGVSRIDGEGGKTGANVCAGERKTSGFQTVPAKRAVTLR